MSDNTTPVRPRLPDNDVVFVVKNPHRPGMLGKLCTVIGEEGGLIGDTRAVFIGHDHIIREITVSVYDAPHLGAIERAIRERTQAEILDIKDVVFEQHRGGKIAIVRTKSATTVGELRNLYTPGVARVSKAVQHDPELAYEYTMLGNTIGIFTNGTRVLGLGDIGPLASLPVMEGKAMLYHQFVGLGAMPILVDTRDPDEFVSIVEKTSVGFAGVHLEDIRTPDCFFIEEELIRRLRKPVMHDDQHGTATVLLAAVINALKKVGRYGDDRLVFSQIGLGAAGYAIAKLLREYGYRVIAYDPSTEACAHAARAGVEIVSFDDAVAADVVIATTGKVGLITREMIRPGQIVFALSNPVPEILPEEALDAGAAFAADGKSVNNALAFPGLFKAAVEMRADSITSAMKIAAAEAIAELAEPDELVPSPFNPLVHSSVVARVREVAEKFLHPTE
ncbi:MAG: NAD-dependent malic enzyme [Chlorobi bacterium]|jgi:malate dehydrogenase (oxaloacetate-decarboxylating)|nr:NAD-dependent malic enzyme [Chlorobiota bacterium]